MRLGFCLCCGGRVTSYEWVVKYVIHERRRLKLEDEVRLSCGCTVWMYQMKYVDEETVMIADSDWKPVVYLREERPDGV